MVKSYCQIAAAALCAAALWACNGSDTSQQPRRITKRQLIDYNRQLHRRDSIVITRYSRLHNLDTLPTSDGIWLTVHQPGEGKPLAEGDVVAIDYAVMALDSTVFYTSAEEGPKVMVVGRGEMSQGVDLALKHLRRGANATVISPPDFAYGLAGDDNRIRGRYIIRYNITVKEEE